MKLLYSKCSFNENIVMRTECHQYESMEEAEKYRSTWLGAGFTYLNIVLDCDSMIVTYQRTINKKESQDEKETKTEI